MATAANEHLRVDKFDRVFQLHAILKSRRTAVSVEDLTARLECSRATLFRTVATLRDTLKAPIEADRAGGGFLYRRDDRDTPYELPGLWFTPNELQALVVMQHLLTSLGGSILEEHLTPVTKRLGELTKHKRLNLSAAAHRIRLPAIAARSPAPSFQLIAGATLQRHKLWFEYHSRSNDEFSERTVSPQRVTYYREAWYLDAWDESRNGLRTFSVDRVIRPRQLEERAHDVSETELDEHFATGYGIFGGKADKVAVLRFSKERARWVADEQWHPEQIGRILEDGRYELRIPYCDSRELVMDVLRHGAEVEVSEPESLRAEVRTQLAVALQQYDR